MDILLREYGNIIRQKKWAALLVIIGITGGIGLDILAPLLYKNIANALAEPFTQETRTVLIDNLIWLGVLFAGIWLSWRLVELGIIPLEAGGMQILDKRCFDVLLKQRYTFFENNFSGSLVKQANRFIRAFESIMDWLIFQFFSNLLSITLAFIIFWWQQPEFALYFLLWAVLFITWSVSYSIWKLKFDERVAVWDSKLGGAYSDSISNIFIVKSFALEDSEREALGGLADETFRKRRLSWLLMFVSFAVQGLLTFAIELILIYLMILKWESGTFEIGEFILFQTILLKLIHGLWDFGRNFRNFFSALADAQEMADVFRRTELEEDLPDTQHYPVTKGSIEFKNLYFHYGAQNADHEAGKAAGDALFEDFNLQIRPNEKVALVGHSGSGKTSLTKLLFRFVEPQAGQVLIDGQDIQDFTLNSLRSQLSLIPQQPELFHRSIRDNITLGKAVSEERLQQVARQARALDFISKLPDRFETLVGERGFKLSGGEKQRVAIARAFLDDAPIVVLDEATSALDSLTEQEIQVAIFELIADKTAIVIAHRLSTILRMDRIIVLEHGKIIEQGTHAELLEKGGRYYQMWQHQSGEFLGEAE
ncbi:MAG: ABC transporter ATP-binding protein [Thiolinea sp.]